jgi:hypothetical protein
MKIQPLRDIHSLLRSAVFLLAVALTVIHGEPLKAQGPPPVTLTVKLLEPIDSAQGTAGQRFHAVMAKDSAVGSITLVKGSPATVTLVPGSGGSRWTLNLIEVTVNGKLAGVFGQNPAVVPTSAGDFFTMSKKTITTPDRIAVAAGENIRFVLGPPPHPGSPPAAASANQPAPPPGASPAASTAAGQDASAAYAKQPVPGPKPGENVHIGPFGSVLYDKDANIEVRLDHCDRQATASSTCDVSVMNRGKPIVLSPAIGGFAIFDSKGQGIGLQDGQAKCCGDRNFGTYLPGVVTHAHYKYDGLDPDVQSLARVSVKFFFTGSGRSSEFEFRNVPLGQVAQKEFTPTPLEPPVKVVEDGGWRMSFERCSPFTRPKAPDYEVVECFFKIENLKADRGIDLQRTNFVDPEGRTFDPNWNPDANPNAFDSPSIGFIGDAATYARTSTVPLQGPVLDHKIYNQPPIKYGEPRYVFAVYSVVPKDVKHIVQLDYSFSWGPNTWFQGTFRDIDITPMPHAAVPAAAAKKTK